MRYSAAMQVLEGMRVLDLCGGPVAGLATMVLADFGADVIMVEPPGGERFATLPAAPMWRRGKRSVVLDLRGELGRERLHGLVDGADVVVAAGPAARAARLAADAESLCARNPSLVHCSISGWGERGPWAGDPAYEGVVAARAGRMRVFEGQIRRSGPAFAAVPVATHACALGAVQGIVAALFARERSGGGQRVETSLLQGLLPYDLVSLLLVQLAQRPGAAIPDPTGVGGGMPTLNYHPVMCADGRWIQLGNLLEHLFYAFLDAIELLPEFLAEERFQGAPAAWKPDDLEAARDRILLRVRERPAHAWMEIFRTNGNVAAEPWLTTQQALDHPDLVANGDVVDVAHPELGAVRWLGPIARLGGTPGRAGGPGPAPGAHTEEVLGERRQRAARRTTPVAEPGRPLAGVTVLEVATIIAAPLATSMLADLGARVIKVELPSGDPYRHLLPQGVMAVKTNAGKQSIAVDLKSPAGREVLERLIPLADVLVHNFRPGVPERLGLSYEQARALRPDIVWVSANGYGPDGPGARRPSAHPVPGAASGGALHQAGSGMPPAQCGSLAEIREAARQLMRANEPNPDPNTSVVIAAAALLGLLARERHGTGQPIWVNMLLANAYANADDFLRYVGKPERPLVDAELTGLSACYRLYRARGGWVFLAILDDTEWARFAAAAQLAPDERFATREGRRAHDAELGHALEAVLLARDADDWEKSLLGVGVACVRADGAAPGPFLAREEHLRANGFVPETSHARFGAMRRWGPLVTCNGGLAAYGPGALAGEHTRALLSELGFAADEIARLYEEGVVATERPF